jgi:hypothetical protein
MADICPFESYQRDTLARELLSSWTRQQIVEWLQQLNNPDYREDMRSRLNQLKQENRNQ